MANIKIIVAAHKKYWMPEDSLYFPIQVGAAGKNFDLGFAKDNTGDNISAKNKTFCELTGLYWAWKNIRADYLGLAHYRRYFSLKKVHNKQKKQQNILTYTQAEKLLEKYDIVLPKPRNYFIETNYSQYVHAHHAIDLDMTREILIEKYPAYVNAFDQNMKKTIGHRFNMFIMKWDKFDAYCTWLFDILFELEKRLDISTYSQNDSRVFGFVGERLIDTWINANEYDYIDIPYIFMENENWIVKGTNFLKRKIGINNK